MAQPQTFSARFGSARSALQPPNQQKTRPGVQSGSFRPQGQGRPPPQGGPRPNAPTRPQGNQQGSPTQKGPAKPKQAAKPKPKPRALAIKIRQVQIEGLVLLKIIKHSQKFMATRQAVAGKLLGLPTNAHTVEVTNCFSEPVSYFKTLSGDVHEGIKRLAEKTSTKHTKEMIHLMSRIRDDNRVVGFYRSALDGEFLSHATIDAQYTHQLRSPASVCIIYDPTASIRGRLVIRAFHLTDQFMNFYAENDFGPVAVAKAQMNANAIFEELDIRIHNSHLVHAFLFDIAQFPPSRALTNKSSRLHHSHEAGLQMNMKQLGNAIDNYSDQAQNFRIYYARSAKNKERRDAFKAQILNENRELRHQGRKPRAMPDLDRQFPPEPEPDRMESVALTAQMNEYCEEVETSIMQGLVKLWVSQGVHAEKVIK